MKPINTPDGHFVGGNGSNVKPTIVTAEWLNAVQDEILNVIEAGEMEPDSTSQLLDAIKLIVSKGELYAKNITDLGEVAILRYASIPSQKLGNMIYVEPFGLMQWSTKWNMYRSINAAQKVNGWATSPLAGYIEANGAWYSKSGNYKGLWTAALDAGLVLPPVNWHIGQYIFIDEGTDMFRVPDLRGYFDRNASQGSEVDTGRIIFSGQDDAMERLTGSFQSRRFQDVIGGVVPTPNGNGLFQMKEKNGPAYVAFSSSIGLVATDTMYLDSSFATRSANETRPMNTAYPAWIKI